MKFLEDAGYGLGEIVMDRNDFIPRRYVYKEGKYTTISPELINDLKFFGYSDAEIEKTTIELIEAGLQPLNKTETLFEKFYNEEVF